MPRRLFTIQCSARTSSERGGSLMSDESAQIRRIAPDVVMKEIAWLAPNCSTNPLKTEKSR